MPTSYLRATQEWIRPSTGVPYYRELEAVVSYDPGYGADADGNRGIGVWLCDEVTEVGGDFDEVRAMSLDDADAESFGEADIDPEDWFDLYEDRFEGNL